MSLSSLPQLCHILAVYKIYYENYFSSDYSKPLLHYLSAAVEISDVKLISKHA